MLFVLDGIDGSGKTSCAKLLCERNPSWESIKVPGHTNEGRVIRDILLNPEYYVRAKPAFFLFCADMLQTLQSLDYEKVYILDRSYYSALIYQVWGNPHLPIPQRRVMESVICNFFPSPEMTFILHADWRVAKARSTKQEFLGEDDQYEAADDRVWQKRAEDYLTLPDSFPSRDFTIIDTTHQTLDRVVLTIESDIQEIIEGVSKC